MMNHTQAIETLAAERYAMDEMSADERDRFETHFFDCLTCADAVRDTTVFIESGRKAIRESRTQKVSRMRGVPGYAAAAMLSAVMGYQNLETIPRLVANQEPPIQVPYAVSISASRAAVSIIPANRTSVLWTVVDDVDAGGTPYSKYAIQIRDAREVTRLEEEIPGDQGKQTLPIMIGKNRLRPGQYTLIVEAFDAAGRRSEQARSSFIVEDHQ